MTFLMKDVRMKCFQSVMALFWSWKMIGNSVANSWISKAQTWFATKQKIGEITSLSYIASSEFMFQN